jgi:transcriptional regulator with XRE-family HTH domain
MDLGRMFPRERLRLEAGFDRTYISLIERGINSPTIRTVVKRARDLKVTPTELLGRMVLVPI